ncbi:SusC/RagA family TonB-linked outer membrane protein [Flavobacterium psychrotolerans]|uniref:SusC/RagA family TonB-linked outer membrane protein n=1 Tax=Flavobacterium psychrotolerans TaxID=2169410 RepID=A0A2U1JQ72_9FLAO|nr:SusC/RagA family TonB-linked outer membrane protein [Flavobacterium psychrotolerans]PWA07155.1 SusC/RagA family TonB-linked outer membrane protein [Flavobacterium psychrotolerans]
MRLKFKWIITLIIALTIQISFAQEKTVTGVVSDKSGTLPGANVVVKGTKRSTQTDLEGRFSIKVKLGETLVFSFIGMTPSIIVVSSSDQMNVKLVEEGEKLGEVIVLGYNSSKRKNDITGNYVKIGGDELNKVPMVSIDQALQGKVAGLTISATSGTPGSVQNIRIRGAQSLYGGNEPLYVIDGMPVASGDVSGDSDSSSLSILSSLSSDNIESMTVLKDASATSVYGARGTNGVILVTTKRGKGGDTKFSATSTVGFQNNAVKGLRPLNGREKQTLLEEGVYNTFGDFGASFTRDQSYQYIVDNSIDPSLVDWVAGGSKEYNWPELMKNKGALLNSLDFSAQGGNQKQNFYMSLGYNKTEATVIGANFKRITASLNYSNQLTNKAKFTNNLSVSNVDQNGIPEQSAFFANPNLTKYFMNPWVSPYGTDGSLNTDMSGTSLYNTIYLSKHDITNNNLTRILNNTNITYEFMKNLKFTSSLGIDYSINSYRNFQNSIHGNGSDTNGYIQESIDKIFKYVSQNSFDYNFRINDDHKFEAKILMEFDKTKFTGLYGYGEDLVRPEFQYINGTSANYQASSYFTDAMNLGYLGLVNYKFKNKYILDVSFRNESSSRFNKETRSGNFYSVGAAWNINEESFLTNIESINLLRMRGSYGTTGNSATGGVQYQSTLGAASYNSAGAISPSSFGGKLQWELANKFDVGVEFELLKSRINGSVAYFKSITSQMLQPNFPLSPTQGFDSYATNGGKMYNKGIEVSLNFDLIQSDKFNWSIGGNYSTVDNEITELRQTDGSPYVITTGTRRNEEGHPAFEWYMRKWAGVDSANGNPLWFINGKDGATTSVYNDAEVAFQGKNALPTFSGGFNSHIELSDFFFDFSFYFAGGNKVFQDWASYTSNESLSSISTYNGTEDLLNRWQNAGDVTDVPKVEATATGSDASKTSTRFLYDGDYVRLRDVTVGYNFKSNILSKFKLDGLSFSVRGTNMLTWVKDSRLKYDPEVDATGFTSLTSPPVKSVVFSVNVKF